MFGVDLSKIVSVECFRVGKSHKSHKNSPTIMLTLKIQWESNWRHRDTILDFIKLHSFPMAAVQMEERTNCHSL